jgi:hypothetical protein
MENEHNELIATRVAGEGDSWILIGDETKHSSLTNVLEAYFQNTGDKCSFRLEPLNSKLFAIKQGTPQPPKRFNIYGDQ